MEYKSQSSFWRILILVFLTLPSFISCRKHQLLLEDDSRRLIHMTTFGFYKGGFLDVQLHGFSIHPPISKSDKQEVVGFTVDRTLSDGINPYPHNVENSCAWKGSNFEDEGVSSILLSFDFKNNVVSVKCSPTLQSNVKVYKTSAQIPFFPGNWKKTMTDVRNMVTQRRKRNGSENESVEYDSENENGDYETEEDEAKVQVPQTAGKEESSAVKPDTVGAPSVVVPQSQPVKAVNPSSGADSVPKAENSETVVKGEAEKPNEEPSIQKIPVQTYIPNGQKVLPDETDSNANPDQFPHSSEENLKEPGPPFRDPALVSESGSCKSLQLPLNATELGDGTVLYSTSFVVYIAGEDCEGLYNLYFHNCAGAGYSESKVNLNMSITEENQNKNFLSAGEMPLPALYFMMSILFFISGCFWVFILKKSRRETGVAVFKIHYLMGALVYLKSLSLLFHSINYHYIQTEGTHVEGWAVLYYIAHLLKGALLFITILLIGTGYAFVKHLLSDKDKKIFMIVIPLQILANVAEIIIDESEEGEIVHTTWKVIFISVDLLCCGAILFPVVWSIRHLQEASQTDGKAATNLRKLKLFRHFYIIVVCYIYFTRIIVNMLLKITVPFQYEWLDEMFREMTTFIFFVLTGYKFRPAANNPYLELAHDSEDETEMDVALTESGLTEGVSKRGPRAKKKTLKEIVLFDPNEEDTDDDEEVLLEKRREASHDFD